MGKYDRYGQHIPLDEVNHQLDNFGEVEECEGEIVCPHCGLIIKPSFETEYKDLYCVKKRCPECEKRFMMDCRVECNFYYTTWSDDEED